MAELRRLAEASMLALRCQFDAHDAVAEVLGTPLPAANRFIEAEGAIVVWISPDEWMIVGGDATLPARLRAALTGRHAAVIDVSGNRVRYALEGADAHPILARGVAFDLDPHMFARGSAASTLYARAQVVLLRRADGFEIMPRRSFAGYLEAMLAAALEAADAGQA